MVQLLLGCSRICDVCRVGNCGETPLSIAMNNQDGSTVQKLLRKAVDLDVKGEAVFGPLYRACKRHNLWVSPLIQQKETLDEPLIVGDLMARGPLFPMRKWPRLLPVAPTAISLGPLLPPDPSVVAMASHVGVINGTRGHMGKIANSVQGGRSALTPTKPTCEEIDC